MRVVQTEVEDRLFNRIQKAAKESERSVAAEIRYALKSVYETDTRKEGANV